MNLSEGSTLVSLARSLNQGNVTLQTVLGGWSWDGDVQLGLNVKLATFI